MSKHCNLPQDMCQLSSEMVDKLESEGCVPEKVGP